MTPIQNSIAYIQGFEFGQDIAKKEIRLAVEAEREACAKLCEAQEDSGGEWDIQQQCANAIRKRGQE